MAYENDYIMPLISTVYDLLFMVRLVAMNPSTQGYRPPAMVNVSPSPSGGRTEGLCGFSNDIYLWVKGRCHL